MSENWRSVQLMMSAEANGIRHALEEAWHDGFYEASDGEFAWEPGECPFCDKGGFDD